MQSTRRFLVPGLVSLLLVASPVASQMVFRHGGGEEGSGEVMVLEELRLVVGMVDDSEEIRVLMVLPDADPDLEVKKDDLLLMVNGKRVKDIETLREAYESTAVGEEMKMGFRRGDQRFLASLEKEEAPQGERRVVMMGGPGMGGDIHPLHEFGVLLTEKDGQVIVAMQLPTDSPAFEEDDVLRSVNGEAMASLDDFRAVYEPLSVGDELMVVMVRDGDEVSASGTKSEFEGRVQVRRAP